MKRGYFWGLIVSFVSLSIYSRPVQAQLWVRSLDTNPIEIYATPSKRFYRPRLRRMNSSRRRLVRKFSDFRRGVFFYPIYETKYYYGYKDLRELFYDFYQDLISNNNKRVHFCKGSNGERSDGSVEISFNCDGSNYTYTCLADVKGRSYEIGVPDEVAGLNCKISVESLNFTNGNNEPINNGVTTETEIELTPDCEVQINVAEEKNNRESFSESRWSNGQSAS